MFFMVSGALLSHKKYSLKNVMAKILKILLLTIFWTIIIRYLLLPIIEGEQPKNSLSDFINSFWFFYTLAFLYGFNYIQNQLKEEWNFLLCCVFLAFPFATNLIWDFIVFFNPLIVHPSWAHTGFLTLYSVAYFYLGAHFSEHRLSKPVSMMAVVLGLGLNCFEVIAWSNHLHLCYDNGNMAFPTFGAMLIAVGLFNLMQYVNPHHGLRRIVTFFGTQVIGVYVFHLLPVYFFRFQVFYNNNLHPVVVVSLAIGVVVFCSALTAVLRRTPIVWLLKF